MNESELSYNYTCPSCFSSFSMSLEKIPPVRARFPCPRCGDPMDFPSRDQARTQARLQGQAAKKEAAADVAAELEKTGRIAVGGEKAFRLDKRGWEDDYFDRRGIRNLIRTGEILERDRVFAPDGSWVVAGEMAELKPLFDLKRKSKNTPPRCCRTHTDRLAHFVCPDTNRPLCEECAPEKKFGENVVRVCSHCGGTTTLVSAS